MRKPVIVTIVVFTLHNVYSALENPTPTGNMRERVRNNDTRTFVECINMRNATRVIPINSMLSFEDSSKERINWKFFIG